MDPLILVDSSPSFDSPQPDRASIAASTAMTPGAPTRRTRRAARLVNIGCDRSILSPMAAPVRGLLPLLYQYGSRPQLVSPPTVAGAPADGRVHCRRLSRRGVDNGGILTNTSLHGEL